MDKEKQIVKFLAEVMEIIPENRKEWFLGYAEGLLDRGATEKTSTSPPEPKAS